MCLYVWSRIRSSTVSWEGGTTIHGKWPTANTTRRGALPFSHNNFVIIAYLFENYLLADETVLGANPGRLLTQWAASGSGSGRCAAAPEGGRAYKVC